MLALGEELVPLVDGGEVWSVHDGVFFHQAQPAAVGGGVEVRVGGQRFPRDSAEGTVAILVSPDMPSEAGVGALCAVFEEGPCPSSSEGSSSGLPFGSTSGL